MAVSDLTRRPTDRTGANAAGGMGSVLDNPPPSPRQPAEGPPPPGGSPFAGLAPSVLPTNQIPPEVLSGIITRASEWDADLEAFAQVTPQLAVDWGLLRDLLKQTLAKVTLAGATPPSPTATGSAFPGGGFARGGAA